MMLETHHLALLTLTGLISGLAGPGAVQAQVEAFSFDSSRVPVGRVFHYVKSNRDGSHPGNVALDGGYLVEFEMPFPDQPATAMGRCA